MRWIMAASFVVAFCTSVLAEPTRAGSDWWSLQPVQAATPPALDESVRGANPIDAFVRARLAGKGLRPAGPADKTTLIRRVTFDLTGLPPTPAEIDAFNADATPNAYERLVDRLLAAPAYGERWARHWLDIVRFSESHGFEYDRLRDHAWRYRDYVIRSLNVDKPFADFVREQLAGDVLVGPGDDGVIATGMLVAGPFDQAGQSSASALVRARAREDELEDMIGTVSQTFLGVTLNCARCHDHKFDPYTARDYYRLKAVFDGVFPGDRSLTAGRDQRAQREAVALLERQIAEARRRIRQIDVAARAAVRAKHGPMPNANSDKLPRPIARWSFDVDGKDAVGSFHAELKEGATIAGGRLLVDGRTAFAATPPLPRDLSAKTLEAWVALPTLKQAGGGVVSVQALDGSAFDAIVFGEQRPLKWMAGSEFFARTRELNGPDESATPGQLIHLAVAYDGKGRVAFYRDGLPYGEPYMVGGPTGRMTFKAKEAQIVFGLRHKGGGNALLNGAIDEARLYDAELTAEQVEASFRAGIERITRAELLAAMSEGDRRALQTAEEEVVRFESALANLRRPIMAYAANVKAHPASVIYKRGDVEKPGDAVGPGAPEIVKGPLRFDLPAGALDAEGRRAFADWVVHRDNPLTWRVIVNRIWQYHFGAGLVQTPSDFGRNGEPPSHPELLDWLADKCRADGGSFKSLHRLILTSATYRQSAAFDARAAALDADNQLLWRFAPRRLEAEAVRDAMLAASGKLNRTAGGPSTRPFRVENFNSAFYILFDEDSPAHNRRAVYRMNVTSARDPVLDVLDCPDPSVKTPRRNTTTTPLQALTMMNGPFTNRLAKAFADRVKIDAGNDLQAQVTGAYHLALGRGPTVEELARAGQVARDVGLTAVCWALFNSNEFAYIK